MPGNPIVTEFPNVAVAVTPSDSVNLPYAMSIYVGATGNVSVLPEGSSTSVTYVGVPAGTVIPCKVRRVNSTNTTASSFIGHYNP